MAKREINVELLRRVKEKILANPESYDQGTFGRKEAKAACGTAACIAGWAAQLGGKRSLRSLQSGRTTSVALIAQKLLRLTDGEADVLFTANPAYCDGMCSFSVWPTRYAKMYAKAKTGRGRARAAAAYLDHIIKTGKVTD